MISSLVSLVSSTLLQSGDAQFDCFASGPDPMCWLAPFTDSMGSLFVLGVVVFFGGSYAIYERNPAPLVVVAVVVGGLMINVLPALAGKLIMLLAIGGAVGALVALVLKGLRQ